MKHTQWLVLAMLLLVLGCAVTEPTDLDRARIAAAVEAEPTRTIQSLSGELGVSELAVVKALPEGMAREWQDEPETAWEAIQAWETAHFEVNTPPIQMIHTGSPRDVRFLSLDTYMQTSSQFPVEIIADWPDIAAVWLLRNPRMGGVEDVVWFFDSDGQAVLKISAPESVEVATCGFDAMWYQSAP